MSLSAWMHSGEEPVLESLEDKWLEADSHRVRYLKIGSGPDLVLLHGILGSADCWKRVLPRLAGESTVYAADALGCGRSDRVEGLNAGLEGATERLLAFLDAANLERIDLLGTSHGGAVAMMFAARYPERVRNLLLHAPLNPYSRVADPLIYFFGTDLGRWFAYRLLFMPKQLQELVLRCMYGPALDGVLEKYLVALREPGMIDHQLEILRGFFVDMKTLAGELPKLREQRILFLWGTLDQAVSLHSSVQLKKVMENSVLTLLPGAGHLPYEECPEEFAHAVNGFLRKQDRESVSRPFLLGQAKKSVPSAA